MKDVTLVYSFQLFHFSSNATFDLSRYHWFTFLRHPLTRFLSEWRHVQRGATWKSARLHCNGRDATLEEVPFCYETSDWKNVTFEEFSSCK